MKTEFELVSGKELKSIFRLKIIGKRPNNAPYVSLNMGATQSYFVKDKDLEKLAVNILKALKSKKLKP